ncbi:MAG: GNAT family N-acetyltransferase [Gammaproteobacteria bacterium]|nr:GNAT family N-acetyltransferase [Gammaproteobacteria bacterium]
MSLFVTRIDLALADHAQALLQLLDEYASHPNGGGKALSAETQKNLIPALQRRRDYLGLLAFEENQPVGLLNGFEGFSSFQAKPLLNIHDLVVTASHRNRGIGQSLLQHAENIACARGYCKLTLEVLSNNRQAQQAYRKFGFKAYELEQRLGHALFWEKSCPSSRQA